VHCCACQQVTCCCCCYVRMDDNSCVMKLVEIVPVDNNNRNCSESAHVKLSPCHVKVCSQCVLPLWIVSSFDIKFIMVALWNRADHYIFMLFLSSFLFPCLISAVGHWIPYFHTWCGLSANLECRSEMCCTRLAGYAGHKNYAKIAIWAPSHNFVGLYLRN